MTPDRVKRPIAVVFDVDDTLYPESQFVRGGLVAAGAVLDARLPRPIGAPDVFLAVLERTGPWHVFDAALAELGVDRDPALVAALVRAFRDHPPRLAPHDGVPGLLDDLRATGVRIGAVTDGYADVQRRKWAALGLDARFDAVVFTGDVGGVAYPKPRFEPFQEVARLLGVADHPVLMVGDNPAKDFPPARALGWDTLRVRHPGGYQADDPDDDPGRVSVSSVAAMAAAVRGWVAAFSG
jgi:putative hydrolase of the HAD superfamily